MVAVDEDSRKPRKVPGLILESYDDIRRFIEASQRKELKIKYKEELARHKSMVDLKEFATMLDGENCQVPDSSELYK